MSLMVLGTPLTAAAVEVYGPCDDPANKNLTICRNSGDTVQNVVKPLVSVLSFITGIIAVVVGIFAGILYTTSAGDQAKVTKAKNTLLGAIIGVVISALAFAIVNWVVDLF